MSTDDKQKRSETMKQKYKDDPSSMSNFVGRLHTAETKAKLSQTMREIAKTNPAYSAQRVCGRAKAGEYNGVKFHSSWELLIAKTFDEQLIKWSRPSVPISYQWHGSRSYFPDFYLEEHDIFVEVKGYETDRDIAKWGAVSNLIVIRRAEIDKIKADPTFLKHLVCKAHTYCS